MWATSIQHFGVEQECPCNAHVVRVRAQLPRFVIMALAAVD